jgi:hypothetical protein
MSLRRASTLRVWVGTRKGDPAGVYFGTSTGTVFYTRDAGDSWHVLAAHLPPVYSVSVANG